jgi:hypothetical protein
LPKQAVGYKAFEQITLPPRPNLLSSPANAYWKVRCLCSRRTGLQRRDQF